MTASSDKVQYLLENCLQESLSLVRRGVFSQAQLQSIMLKRQKQEHNMLKTQYKLTDYLAAIEYQYELQRQRRNRMSQMSKLQEGSNPLFKKQSSSDFAIVKRIVRLWDRTMHKFKFQTKLWKQYLSFTLAIGSKKHFYKALTNALRFQPFDVDLWKIGAAYEQQQGKNLWKGRKILIKGMKMVPVGPRNIQLAEFMIEYEVNFLKTLLQRRDILIKGEEGMRLIGQQEQDGQYQQIQPQPQADVLNLEQFDRVIWLVVEQAMMKNAIKESKELNFQKIKRRLIQKIKSIDSKQQCNDVKQILSKVLNKLSQFTIKEAKLQQIQVEQQQPEIKIQQRNKNISSSNYCSIDAFKQRIAENGTKIDWQQVKRYLKSFCLKPNLLSQVLNYLLEVNLAQTISFIYSKYEKIKLPSATLLKLIEFNFDDQTSKLKLFIAGQIDRWVTPADLHQNRDLLEKLIRFNIQTERLKNNANLQRSLSIAYRNQPQFLEECARINQNY